VHHDRNERREKLRLLDGCLHVLEDYHQQGEVAVPAPVAAKLRPHVAAVTPGMSISDAIEAVFTEQAPYLGAARSDLPMTRPRGDHAARSMTPAQGAPVRPASRAGNGRPLNEAGARALTERIRSATRHVCLLLMEAHEGRAWSALGYRTWERYAKQEFGLSRSRSYELLDQGRVIAELQLAAGMSEIPDISAYVAGQIKPYLSEVTRSIRDRAGSNPEAHARHIVGDVVRQARTRARASRDARRRPLQGPGLSIRRPDLDRLRTALECLASMPDAAETAVQASVETGPGMPALEPALQWLNDFAEEVRRRSQANALRHLLAQNDENEELAVGA
jgi:hypothetical protein